MCDNRKDMPDRESSICKVKNIRHWQHIKKIYCLTCKYTDLQQPPTPMSGNKGEILNCCTWQLTAQVCKLEERRIISRLYTHEKSTLHQFYTP